MNRKFVMIDGNLKVTLAWDIINLNTYDASGWELIQIIYVDHRLIHYFFKRKIL